MGNVELGCCSGSNSYDRCCNKTGAKQPEGGATPSKPLPSSADDSEVMGTQPQAPPGINSLVNLGEEVGNDTEADTAAGKSNVISCKDGSRYEGQLVNGKRHGTGVCKSPTSEYAGQWEDDCQKGQGVQRWTDGRVYEGQFVNGKFSGEGRMVWSTQKGYLVYEGQYRDDLKHGFGKFVWADGRTYEGEWCLGKRHGRGRYINARLEQKVGYWIDDKFNRWEVDNGKSDDA